PGASSGRARPRRADVRSRHGQQGRHRTFDPPPCRFRAHRGHGDPRPAPGRAGRSGDRSPSVATSGGAMMLIVGATPGGSPLSGPIGYGDVALSLLLVAVAIGFSRWQRVGLERDMTVATVRSFAQLVAVGYSLEFIFKVHGGLTILALAVLVG